MSKVSIKVACLVSGGVDSAVAAYLLQRQGYQVEAVFMKNWTPLDLQNPGDCPWQQDQDDAEAVARQLQIPFRSVNFEREYQRDVAAYFVNEYAAGRTPNPDIICNQKIKFGAAWEWAKKEGFNMIATGHYARLIGRRGQRYIARGRDRNKDQSYFLAAVPTAILPHVCFPLGTYTKPQVRKLASRLMLPVATKKDSQGICFIGQLPVREFLRRSIKTKRGPVCAPDGTVIGTHAGAALYTIGQRHGWQVTDAPAVGRAFGVRPTQLPPLFVSAKVMKSNTLTVDVASSSTLNRRTFRIQDIVWYGDPVVRGQVQIRYRSRAVRARLCRVTATIYDAQTRQAVWAAAPGQFAVIYQRGVVVGYGHVV